jgi:hypothetical protein
MREPEYKMNGWSGVRLLRHVQALDGRASDRLVGLSTALLRVGPSTVAGRLNLACFHQNFPMRVRAMLCHVQVSASFKFSDFLSSLQALGFFLEFQLMMAVVSLTFFSPSSNINR